MAAEAPKYAGNMCFGAGGCQHPSDSRFPSNYTIGGETRCKVVPGQPETRIDGDFLNRLGAGLGGRTLHDALEANGTPVYFVIGHSSYDSVFDVGADDEDWEKRSVKFDQPATMFQVPEKCYYVSTSATGWGMLSSETATSLGSDIEDDDHILNSSYEKVMSNLFSNEYTCGGGRLGDKDEENGERQPVVDPDSGKPARIGVQVYGSEYNPVPQKDWLQVEQKLNEGDCPGLLTLQSGYFLPKQWAYNKSHQFYGSPLTRDGFGIIELSVGSKGALQDGLLAVDGIAGRTRSHYAPEPAKIQKVIMDAIDERRLTHMSLTDAEGNATGGSVYFAKSRTGGVMKEEEIACWHLIREAVVGGREKEVYMSEIMNTLSRNGGKPIVVCALSCSEQYVKMHDRKRGVVAYAPQQLAEMSGELEVDFATTMIDAEDAEVIPPEYLAGARVMGAMVASSLQLQTTMHISNGKLWDAACGINAAAGSGDGDTKPLVVGWSGTEPTSKGTSLSRLLERRLRSTTEAVVSVAKKLTERTGGIAKLALPCFFAEDWLAPLINVSEEWAAEAEAEMDVEDRLPEMGAANTTAMVAAPRRSRFMEGGPDRNPGTSKERRVDPIKRPPKQGRRVDHIKRLPKEGGGEKRRLATRKRRRLPRKRTKVWKSRSKKKTRNHRDRKGKSRKRTRRRR